MNARATLAVAALVTATCQPAPRSAEPRDRQPAPAAAGRSAAPGWSLQSGAQGTSVTLADAAGRTVLRLACAGGQNRLVVTVPAFRAIGSEDRLSLGGEYGVETLVADLSTPSRGPGVTATGPIPDELKRVIIAPMTASYGAQSSGPHPPVPDRLGGPFLTACQESLNAVRAEALKPNASTHPCHVQDGRLLRISMRALGTEPFWNAKIDGRCVTYSTPENQAGTRLWTTVGDGPQGPVFSGAYNGRPFGLILEPRPDCSDGMSDRRYDWEARLTVEGEQRTGCAEVITTGR